MGGRRIMADKALLKPISGLLSYQISRLAGALTRSATQTYRERFDVSIGEWRVIALLGEHPGTTLNRLARRAALDKAQISRVVSKLLERGLVQRESGPRRSSVLSLTKEGETLYLGLITAANERDVILRGAVPAKDLIVFERVINRLHEVARDLEARDVESA